MEFWLTERQSSTLTLSHRVDKVLHWERTPYQELAIVELGSYGRALVLDSIVQTTLVDEFVYHEMITHVAMNTHPDPKEVLIIGGGDGGAVREVLKHEEVCRVTLVEIDERVVINCREYLPEIAGSLGDPRVRMIFDDGVKHAAESNGAYDVILIDSPDPIGPAVGLYGRDFYQNVHKALKPDGLMVAQTESPWVNRDLLPRVHQYISSFFPVVRTYCATIPTYQGGQWTFTMGSKVYDPKSVDSTTIPAMVTRYYHPELHGACLVVPKFIKDLIGS